LQKLPKYPKTITYEKFKENTVSTCDSGRVEFNSDNLVQVFRQTFEFPSLQVPNDDKPSFQKIFCSKSAFGLVSSRINNSAQNFYDKTPKSFLSESENDEKR